MTEREDIKIEGGCLCRAVRYSSLAPPLVTRICWCRACQYLAANGTVNVGFPSATFHTAGECAEYRSVADSGTVMFRRFCPSCGTHLFSQAESRRHLIFVRAGTLDDPNVAQPSLTIWTSQAPRWACLDPSIPSIPHQPPPVA